MLAPPRLVLAALTALALGACAPAPEADARLDEVLIPSDFTFATQRAVTLAFGPEVALDGARVEVSTADAELLFVGAVGAERVLRLPLATRHDTLTVRLQDARGETLRQVDVVDGVGQVER
jgi:hypothetical protein